MVSSDLRAAFLWSASETSIIVGASIVASVEAAQFVSDFQWPLFLALWLIFGIAATVGLWLGDDLEGMVRALFISQICSTVLISIVILSIVPPPPPGGAPYVGDYGAFEIGYVVILGLWVFISSLAGSFAGWFLNGLVGSNTDYTLDWKRVVTGLGIIVFSISLPVSPLAHAGAMVVFFAVVGTAISGLIIVRSGLNRRVPVSSELVGFLVVVGLLVLLLSAFSVNYVFDLLTRPGQVPILLWSQCLTLLAPGLLLIRLLFRGLNTGGVDYSTSLHRKKL